jgi:hypothetical protein
MQPEPETHRHFDETPEEEAAPASSVSSHQPHITKPQYADVNRKSDKKPLSIPNKKVSKDDDGLDIPAFIRKKMM